MPDHHSVRLVSKTFGAVGIAEGRSVSVGLQDEYSGKRSQRPVGQSACVNATSHYMIEPNELMLETFSQKTFCTDCDIGHGSRAGGKSNLGRMIGSC